MSLHKPKLWIKSAMVLLLLTVGLGAGWLFLPPQMLAHITGFNPVGTHGHGGMHGHGADGTGHDEVNMPGLNGENATAEESEELRILFRNFKTLSREVTNLPDGIRTVTRSSDEEVMAKLVSHVSGMINRVSKKDDPKIFIQSPTLDIFFARGDKIKSTIDVTDEGVVVVQTSDDPEVVTALHTHAAEVSELASRGMEAVHEQMMKRTGN